MTEVVLPAGFVISDHLTNELAIKVLVDGGSVTQEPLADITPHSPSQPLVDGVCKPLFLSVDHVLRQPFLYRLLMQVFPAQAAESKIWREAFHEFNQTVVKEGDARFNRVSHRGFVAPHQDIALATGSPFPVDPPAQAIECHYL